MLAGVDQDWSSLMGLDVESMLKCLKFEGHLCFMFQAKTYIGPLLLVIHEFMLQVNPTSKLKPSTPWWTLGLSRPVKQKTKA